MAKKHLGWPALVVFSLLAGCGGSGGGAGGDGAGPGGGDGDGAGGGGSSDGVTLPPPNATFDYQIGGPYAPSAGVEVVDRDWHEAPAAGKYGICYVNAFQAQPGELDWWRARHPDLLLKNGGVEVVDEDWGEVLLDTSTVAKRDAILAIVGAWIDACATAGYQAVEPDNLDSWTRSQDLLTEEDAVAMATLLAGRAHARGLAIAQKNAAELLPSRSRIGFDFAVVEECQEYQEWGECDAFSAAYGDRWFEIEYQDATFDAACRARGGAASIIRRDRDVVPRGEGGYVYEAC